MIEKIKAVVIGHAIGDALGAPVEFASRTELDNAPVTDMEGYGTYPVPAGAWSDDTSMSLCTMDALIKYGLDYDRIMVNFGKWYYNDEFTPTGEMFDVGNTCSTAIENYVVYKKHYTMCGLNGERDNGNGSLMRIHPMVLYLANREMPLQAKMDIIHTTSALTHAHMRAKIACGIYAFVLWEILSHDWTMLHLEAIRRGLSKARRFYSGNPELVHFMKLFHQIADIDKLSVSNPKLAEQLPKLKRSDIHSDGYDVNTLEAAIWCVMKSSSYKDCVLKAVNLGDDTDTVAAVAGGLAGALYGYEAIPQEWKDVLIKRDYIEELCSNL